MRKDTRGSLAHVAGRILATAVVLGCAVAPPPAGAKAPARKQANPRLLKADLALQDAIPAPGAWPLVTGGNDFSPEWPAMMQEDALMNSNWDGLRRLAENIYALAPEVANGENVDAMTAQQYGGYPTLRKLYGPAVVHACTAKSPAAACLRQSVQQAHRFEQEIASKASRFIGLLEDDIGSSEPGVVSTENAAAVAILNKVSSDINAVSAFVPTP
jgi:hypothetical protein